MQNQALQAVSGYNVLFPSVDWLISNHLVALVYPIQGKIHTRNACWDSQLTLPSICSCYRFLRTPTGTFYGTSVLDIPSRKPQRILPMLVLRAIQISRTRRLSITSRCWFPLLQSFVCSRSSFRNYFLPLDDRLSIRVEEPDLCLRCTRRYVGRRFQHWNMPKSKPHAILKVSMYVSECWKIWSPLSYIRYAFTDRLLPLDSLRTLRDKANPLSCQNSIALHGQCARQLDWLDLAPLATGIGTFFYSTRRGTRVPLSTLNNSSSCVPEYWFGASLACTRAAMRFTMKRFYMGAHTLYMPSSPWAAKSSSCGVTALEKFLILTIDSTWT